MRPSHLRLRVFGLLPLRLRGLRPPGGCLSVCLSELTAEPPVKEKKASLHVRRERDAEAVADRRLEALFESRKQFETRMCVVEKRVFKLEEQLKKARQKQKDKKEKKKTTKKVKKDRK